MKIRVILTNAAAFALIGAVAQAEEGLQPNTPSVTYDVCRFNAGGGGCTHFEGYVYVRRGSDAAPATLGKAASDASMGGGRLYLHVDGGEMR